jgi:hypothetical protein
MRLLDRVAQATDPYGWVEPATGRTLRLLSACDFAAAVRGCPTRYVLSDPLAVLCTALAYADGDRLQGCLDLVRVPAQELWVEWNDAARAAALPVGALPDGGVASVRPGPAGLFVQATADGRRGRVRTFWAEGPEGPAEFAPAETWFDLDRGADPAGVDGPWYRVTDPDPSVDAVYSHLRFRIEPGWAASYARSGLAPAQQAAAIRDCLAAVARDVPVLLALCLLLNARQALERRSLTREVVNRQRARHPGARLLDHVELHAALDRDADAVRSSGVGPGGRQSPRLHHVRGHLVRRRDRVYWRVPHLRGSAAAGTVRTRTVTLRFDGVATQRQ